LTVIYACFLTTVIVECISSKELKATYHITWQASINICESVRYPI